MLASAWLQMVILAGLQGPVPASPEAALQAYQSAVARADVVALADLTSGSPGVTLRKLAPALKKAQNASDALTKTLASKPAWNL
ncbi:MAG TPA: hypothetical protein PKA06_14045, partial [Gemmatales bacterium]|nr:hypothetical protein [Gemmatales bacterium]